MPIPTDTVGAILWGVNLVLDVMQVPADFAKLAEGVTAKAQAEGRDVTPDEEALIDALVAESEKARDGDIEPEPPKAA